ncbi:MAG: hypothetical protein HY597_06405, partial [Candidatus Omnitrophica bacterium]|nr:hypothetical protein [Candidatus Omnitrophota bacterium]
MSLRPWSRIQPTSGRRVTGNERGWTMLMTYSTMTVLLILVGTLINRSLTDIRATQQYGRLRLSYYAAQGLAELGVEWMRAMMTRTPPWLPNSAVELYPVPSPELAGGGGGG